MADEGTEPTKDLNFAKHYPLTTLVPEVCLVLPFFRKAARMINLWLPWTRVSLSCRLLYIFVPAFVLAFGEAKTLSIIRAV